MNPIQSILAIAALAAAPLAVVLADRPPADAKPLVEIVEQLEQQGYGPFTDVSFDDGYWEVEVFKKDTAYELLVDRRTGKVLSEQRDHEESRPPRDAKPLSQILRDLAKAGHTRIHDVSFEYRYWEIESLLDDGEHELHVDPKTGKILRMQRDD